MGFLVAAGENALVKKATDRSPVFDSPGGKILTGALTGGAGKGAAGTLGLSGAGGAAVNSLAGAGTGAMGRAIGAYDAALKLRQDIFGNSGGDGAGDPNYNQIGSIQAPEVGSSYGDAISRRRYSLMGGNS